MAGDEDQTLELYRQMLSGREPPAAPEAVGPMRLPAAPAAEAERPESCRRARSCCPRR